MARGILELSIFEFMKFVLSNIAKRKLESVIVDSLKKEFSIKAALNF